MKILWIVLGILISGYKGIKLLWNNDKGMADNWFGFKDAALDAAWSRVDDSKSFHNLTNLIVEWNRLHAQRGAKVLSGVATALLVVLCLTATLILIN